MSLQTVFSGYTDSCACGTAYENNCAHFLSNALIKGGFSAINGGNGGDLRTRNGFCVCPSGRPIRAKELRAWFGRKWTRHTKPQNGLNLMYQEQGGQGHVLLKKYPEGNWVGRGDHGNWNTQEYYYYSGVSIATKSRL